MKYINKYFDVINDYRIKASKMSALEEEQKIEWALFCVCLLHPEKNPEFYRQLIQDLYNIETKNINIKQLLRNINMNAVEKREYILHIVQTQTQNIKKMLDGDKNACKLFKNFLDTRIERSYDNRMYLKSKALLINILMFEEELKVDFSLELFETFMEPYCGKVLKSIYESISTELGIKNVSDVNNVLEQTKAVIEQGVLLEKVDKSKNIDELIFENNNYRNTLEILQSMFDELKETNAKPEEEIKKATIRELFGKLNSSDYGYLLDNLLSIEKMLQEVRKNKVQIPPQINSLPIVFKKLLKFVKDIGIEPIVSMPCQYYAKYEDIAQINYIGEPFVENEVKYVEVSSPGWRYGDIVISEPTVREKRKEED